MSDDVFDFPSNDELEKAIPADTPVVVRARLYQGGYEPTEGTNDDGRKWMRLSFIIEGGEFDGRPCSMLVTLSGTDRRFRAVTQVATGKDLSKGERVTKQEFIDAIRDNRFKALATTRGEYTNVTRLVERLEAGASGGMDDAFAPSSTAPVDEGDIPF